MPEPIYTEILEIINNIVRAIELSNIGEKRVKIMPPALTIPACIIADTGVGATTDSINQL